MSYDLSNLLVIGISSRALFDLECEDRIFRTEGLQAFVEHQRINEDVVLRPGAGFPLVKGLLKLNETGERRVEVILLSKNHPDVSLRVFNSINQNGLDISRAALTGGAPLGPYLNPFKVDLFLSQDVDDVQSAANQGFAAGLIYSPPPDFQAAPDKIRIAFDGDCVVFSDEAQQIFEREGLEAFRRYEEANAKRELPAGPFAKLLRTLSQIQGLDPETSPVRIALVTDRNTPAHERVIRTLRAWNVRIDEAFFLGGMAKGDVIKAFGAQMFFDDKEEYCKSISGDVPTGRVLLPIREQDELTIKLEASRNLAGQDRFLLICRTYLKRDYGKEEAQLKEWFHVQVEPWSEPTRSDFLDELEESVHMTPPGNQRRGTAAGDNDKSKLWSFLESLAFKHGKG